MSHSICSFGTSLISLSILFFELIWPISACPQSSLPGKQDAAQLGYQKPDWAKELQWVGPAWSFLRLTREK